MEWLGGGEGHVSRDCSAVQKAKTCYKCGEEGHIVCLFSKAASLVPRYLSAQCSRAIARKPATRQLEATRNATNAARLATSLVPAPNPPALEALTSVVPATEATMLLEVVVKKPGMMDHQFFTIKPGTHTTRLIAILAVALGTFLVTVGKVPSVTTVLDWYGLHFPTAQLSLTMDSRSRVTSAGTAPSPRSALATTVVLKGLCTSFLPYTER